MSTYYKACYFLIHKIIKKSYILWYIWEMISLICQKCRKKYLKFSLKIFCFIYFYMKKKNPNYFLWLNRLQANSAIFSENQFYSNLCLIENICVQLICIYQIKGSVCELELGSTKPLIDTIFTSIQCFCKTKMRKNLFQILVYNLFNKNTLNFQIYSIFLTIGCVKIACQNYRVL